MFKNILEKISGIEVFPMISLLIFAIVFSIVIIWVIKMDKTKLKHMENLPFEDSTGDKNGQS